MTQTGVATTIVAGSIEIKKENNIHDAVRDMFINQRMSYDQIAAAMGVTRGAIAGICGRNGWKRERAKITVLSTKRRDDRVISIKKKSAMREKTEKKSSREGVSLMELEFHHCRWIIGTGEDGLALYCGKTKATDLGAYCEHHARLSRGGSKQERRD